MDKPNEKAIAKRSPTEEMKVSLTKMSGQFKMALPPQITTDKFIRVTMTAIQQVPSLIECDRTSLFAAVMRCAQDGLLPDGREAALVPFRNKGVLVAQYLPMTAGILKKVRNSGELISINSQVVYENDNFRYWIDETGEHLSHTPNFDTDRGVVKLTYAIAKTKDGGVWVEVVTEKQMDAVRNMSRAKDSGPWAGAFQDEMRRKTAIRRLSKRLPMSTDLEEVLHADDNVYDVTQPPQAESETKKISRLDSIIQTTAVDTPIEPSSDDGPSEDAEAKNNA